MERTKQNLVVFSPWYDPFIHGGAEQMVREILKRIGREYNTTLITGLYDRKLPRKEQREGFFIRRIGFGFWWDKYIYSFLAPIYAIWYRPNIIHAVMESYGAIALVFSKYISPRAKRILTLQSADLDENHKQKQIGIRLFWKSMHKSPDVLTAISSYLAKRGQKFRNENDQVILTPNGIDFTKIPNSTRRDKNRVLCVARLNWAKGLNYLLEAWPDVLKQVPEAKLVFVSDGEKKSEMEQTIKEQGTGETITFAGKVTHDEVLQHMVKSEIFVLPSLAEGLGNVFFEAQACGLVPIGTNVGGIPDIISHEENGLLIEPKNSKQISEALVRLLKDDELRKKLADKAAVTVRKFDWNSVMETFRKIYAEEKR